MVNFCDGRITDLLNNSLKYNPQITALSFAVFKEKHRIMEEVNKTRTMAFIDGLPDAVLDILAVELRTPLYREEFSVGLKRELIKDTLIYYTYMGTPQAVTKILSAIFPVTTMSEWFEYGGEPYHFQITLDLSNYSEDVDPWDLIKNVNKTKRLSAHMDSLVYLFRNDINLTSKIVSEKRVSPHKLSIFFRNFLEDKKYHHETELRTKFVDENRRFPCDIGILSRLVYEDRKCADDIMIKSAINPVGREYNYDLILKTVVFYYFTPIPQAGSRVCGQDLPF